MSRERGGVHRIIAATKPLLQRGKEGTRFPYNRNGNWPGVDRNFFVPPMVF
jgi:hypothetical protein